MAVIVQKYGGSSVADVQKIGQVADKVVAAKQAGNDIVVVVSAMGKTTDGLLALAREVAGSGATTSGEPPRRELDMLVSTGERVSMALLSIAIHARGHSAISFTGSQCGIITNDRHFDARILEVRPFRIEDELARGRIVIVAGYQGVSYKREITTLGRGGSDTTAVALAAALSAERCEIYSDVDGVYSADPRVVAEPVHLPEITLGTLQEMAEAGAKVLNAQAVEWARRAKVAIYARKTSDKADASGRPVRETVAYEPGENLSTPQTHVRAVVGLDRVVVVEGAIEQLGPFCKHAAEHELPLLEVSAAGKHFQCGIALMNLPDWSTSQNLLMSRVEGLRIGENMAWVSVVGDGLTTSTRALPRFLGALDDVGATPTGLSASPLRLSTAIESRHLTAAQRKLHELFVEA